MEQHNPDLESRSPWSMNHEKPMITIHPPKAAVAGTITLSGSKSLTNRALIIAALAEGTSRLEGILRSDDSYWCLDCLTKLGVNVSMAGETAYVTGCGGAWPVRSGELYVGAAGTVARFLPGALATSDHGCWTVTGSKRMGERPLAPLLSALSDLGASIRSGEADRSVPFTLEARGLRGGEAALPGATSSQFISGLLIAAPYAASPLTIRINGEVVQRDYVDMTLSMMRLFGICPKVIDNGQAISVPAGKYQAHSIRLEPDVSACCYFWALAAITEGRIRIEGICAAATSQPDIEILKVLERMGCYVVRGDDFVEVTGTRQLKGGFTVSMKAWSDQTLTIAAMAVFADAPITMTDAAHIRHHECDRISAVCAELRKLGIRVEERMDGLTVYPGQPKAAVLETHDDHRMAMALSLIGARSEGIRLMDPGCVSKTCPDYFERLAALGIGIE
ncbi:3-phosphoshikimate 1-carboxyvinyltransferase [Paenibacillus sp. GD4]|uniref:3-phosphoshikimate 1-carboxyvinyltransferase n=1 Tax=Paenibacillus sp. GD4 TaxID=3068890 RepID=UPI0027964F50|nr:3-phosphoshikimate 1-carboxyvinyltransferase [Paenibacillus sp. GD4]MDQ1913466.1 3-phosphoshikimate 1-carboxyvinyltransferase [Paenibacillus sp. GD4]